MASSRRQSNGRSPLVNKQFQITSFFSSKPASSTPSPLQNPNSTLGPNRNPRDPSDPDDSPSSSPSPATPSPVQFNPRKKTPLVIPSAPASPKPYGREVLRKRVRVYWPLDEAWYEGCVKSFDERSGKHLVQYDDAEEELLDLGKEKIEWVKESAKKFKRLRRGGGAVSEKVVEDVESDEGGKDLEKEKIEWVKESAKKFKRLRGGGGAVLEKVVEDVESDEGSKDSEDDTSDEDWGESAEKKTVEDAEDEDMEAGFTDEEDAGEKSSGGKSRTRKRRVSEGSESTSAKKNKNSSGVCNDGSKVSVVVSGNKFNCKDRVMLTSRFSWVIVLLRGL